MFPYILKLILLYLTLVKCDNQLVVLYAPRSFQFKNNVPLPASSLKDVYSASLGYSVPTNTDWSGLYLSNPFDFPECMVTFIVPGMDVFKEDAIEYTFPLVMDEDLDETYDTLLSRTELRYPNVNQTHAKITLGDKPMVDGSNMILSNEEAVNRKLAEMEKNGEYASDGQYSDPTILKNLKYIDMFVKELMEKKNSGTPEVPQIYWVVLSGLKSLSDNEVNSDSANTIMSELLAKAKTLGHIYDGKILVTAITTDPSESRIKRNAENPATLSLRELNVATDYDPNFPVIFNIILWFSVALALSITAISLSIAGMDPGRDSIIYRMTSTRMKKEN